jgi:hypothetical protein
MAHTTKKYFNTFAFGERTVGPGQSDPQTVSRQISLLGNFSKNAYSNDPRNKEVLKHHTEQTVANIVAETLRTVA